MKRTFFARWALPTLMVIFFLVPFAMRGARMAINQMENNVKDWLPDDFPETVELDWFRERFMGDQFVLVSWEGCTGRSDDERFKTFINKLFPEAPPSERKDQEDGEQPPPSVRYMDPDLQMYVRQLPPDRNRDPDAFLGNRLGLLAADQHYRGWGGEGEKWIRGEFEQWYYITPSGDLYRWKVGTSWLARLIDWTRHKWQGDYRLQGELITSLGPIDGPWYYSNPNRLSMRPFKSITTGPGVLHQLTREGGVLEGDVPQALERLQGALFGPDGKQTCVILTLSDAAKRNLRAVLGRGLLGHPQGVLLRLASESGVHAPPTPTLAPPPLSWWVRPPAAKSPMLRMGGPPVDNVAIDEEGEITLVRLIGLSVAVGVGLAWFCLRSIGLTIIVFLCGGISAIASVSLVYWSGSTMDAVLMSMPSLVYVLGLSGAIHIVNYYREEVGEKGLVGAPERAVRHGWGPCFLAALTTAVGLGSLAVSNLVPIRKFGFFAGVAVMATLILLFTYVPAALQLWPPRIARHAKMIGHAKTRFDRLSQGFWMRLGEFIIRRHAWVFGAGVVMFAVFGYGTTRINTSIQLLKLFDSQAKIIQDYEWLEQRLGKLVPMEIVVHVDQELFRSDEFAEVEQPAPAAAAPANEQAIEGYQLSFLERMEMTEYIRQAIESQFGERGQDIVGRAMMASTFAPPLPAPGAGLRQIGRRGATSRILLENRDEFLESDYLRLDQGDELWRISLRLAALSDVDYGAFVHQLQSVVEPILAAYRTHGQIVRNVQRQRGDPAVRGAGVVLAGAPLGPMERDANRSADEDESPAGEPSLGQKQTSLFTATLLRLLQSSGIRVLAWHDPRYPLPPAWQTTLSDADTVVVLQKAPQYEGLDQQAPLVLATDHRFQPTVDKTANQRGEPLRAIYTGLVPVVYKAQRTLLTSLVESTGWAFVLILVVMAVVLRSFRAGLLSMLPNLFPLVIVFGAMGWSRIVVDIGSMMTASVALGVAVDDTIHFLSWFRRGLDAGLDRFDAIRGAYERVATAMTQTTAIGGLGLAIFALSTFTPTQRFGVLMLSLLVMALVGDLILLPALLAGPLGRVFRPHGAQAQGDRKSSGDRSDEPSRLEVLDAIEPSEPHSQDVAPHWPKDARGPHRRSDQPHHRPSGG